MPTIKRPTIKLHKIDGTHPDILGTYLAACVVYASIYKDNPIGISYDYNGAINSEDKLFLQRLLMKQFKNISIK